MKARRPLALAALVVLVTVVVSARAPASPPNPAVPAAPSASASAAPAARSDVPGLDADPPGPDKSPLPKAAEWTTATRVRLTRVGPVTAACNAVQVREWLRIRCAAKTFAVSLLGGPTDGLAFWIGPEAEGQPGEVQFPLRRGDRRVVQFWTPGKDADGGFQAKPLFVVQEQWVDGEAAPTVTAL